MNKMLQDKYENLTKITDVKSLEQTWLGIVDVFQEDNTVNYSKSLLRMVRF